MLIVLLDLYDIFVGINLKQGQGKHLTSKELFAKTAKVSPLYQGEKRTSQTKSKLLSPKETRASELRKQAQLKKTNPLDIKKTVSFFFRVLGGARKGVLPPIWIEQQGYLHLLRLKPSLILFTTLLRMWNATLFGSLTQVT